MSFLPFLGAGAAAAGSVLQGVSSANAAHYQAQVANNNAITERQNAQHAAAATSVQTEQAGLKARSQDAGVRASIAANNLDVSTGSPVDVQQSEHELGQLDVAQTASRGAEQVYGYETQAVSDKAQSNLYQSEVAPDIAGGVLKGAGSLLSGSPSLPGAYQWMSGGGGDGGSTQDANGAPLINDLLQ